MTREPIISSRRVHLGKNCRVDATARLGEASGRKGLSLRPLRLGNSAHIRSASVLYAGSSIGHHLETGHGVVIREENRIGHDVSIWNHTTIDYGCRIGNRVKIHCNCYVAQHTVIEDDVFIAPGVTFANDLYPKSRHAEKVLQGPVIQRGAVIGANCTILPGVVIGPNALIGAGSVVTHSVPASAVVWGNPATVHKDLRDLRWPEGFEIRRAKAAAFYRRHLRSRPAYS